MQPSGAARRRRRRTSQSLDYCSTDDSAVVVDDDDVMFRATDSLTHSEQRNETRSELIQQTETCM